MQTSVKRFQNYGAQSHSNKGASEHVIKEQFVRLFEPTRKSITSCLTTIGDTVDGRQASVRAIYAVFKYNLGDAYSEVAAWREFARKRPAK